MLCLAFDSVFSIFVLMLVYNIFKMSQRYDPMIVFPSVPKIVCVSD